MVEEVLTSFTQVKVAIQLCKSTPQQVKVLHSRSYLSKSKVLSASIESKTHSVLNWSYDGYVIREIIIGLLTLYQLCCSSNHIIN